MLFELLALAGAAEFLSNDRKETPNCRERKREPVREDENDDLMTFALVNTALDLL